MSIIMLAAAQTRGHPVQAAAPAVDPSLRGLLDHIAVELAEEYIRLMEAAAAAEHDAPLTESEENREP
jgi:hypothetical protein